MRCHTEIMQCSKIMQLGFLLHLIKQKLLERCQSKTLHKMEKEDNKMNDSNYQPQTKAVDNALGKLAVRLLLGGPITDIQQLVDNITQMDGIELRKDSSMRLALQKASNQSMLACDQHMADKTKHDMERALPPAKDTWARRLANELRTDADKLGEQAATTGFVDNNRRRPYQAAVFVQSPVADDDGGIPCNSTVVAAAVRFDNIVGVSVQMRTSNGQTSVRMLSFVPKEKKKNKCGCCCIQ